MSLVSIIMPVNNTAPYLKDCIQSIIGQDFQEWELIAVNDNSNDESLQILRSFSEYDPRINVYDNPFPGLIRALQLGYSKSSGTYITRMDSDDIMPSNKLSSMVELLKIKGQGSLITGKVKYFNEDHNLGDGFIRYAEWINQTMDDTSFNKNLYKECVIPSCCWLVQRNDFDRIGGFEPDAFPEDYDLCFRFIHGDLNIISLDQVLHHWRDRPDRISRTREEYRDNRFFELKVDYFLRYTMHIKRPLVIWGAGTNGKDLVKELIRASQPFHWVCQNEKKIGVHIYNQQLNSTNLLLTMTNPQILVAVSSPEEQEKIREELNHMNKKEGEDYWFFI